MDRAPTTGRPPPDEHDAEGVGTPSRHDRLKSSVRNLTLAAVAVAVVGLLSGWLFARGAPQTAAATSISALVEDVEVPGTPVAPDPTCGSAAPAHVDLDAVRAAGIVVIRASRDHLQTLVELAGDRPVLIVPGAPETGVVETSSSGRRMALDELRTSPIDAYITAYARSGACDGDEIF